MNFVVIRWYKSPIIDVTSQICRDIIARLSFLNGLEAMVISAVETLNMSGAFRTVFWHCNIGRLVSKIVIFLGNPMFSVLLKTSKN